MRRLLTSKHMLLLLIVATCLAIPSFSSATQVPPAGSDEKIVYLTFDDGPTSTVTEAILDVLKKEDVKATFFIVGKEIKGREDILKRIYEEGHGIGLHTFSHNFKIIYQNPESFIMEMEKTEALINKTLGTKLRFPAIRFPGGSAGRLNQRFYDRLCEKGYLIFDWNVDLQDGIKGHLPPSQFVANSKKCMTRGNRRIILAHCNANNTNTCKALSDIIAYYRSQGYTFDAITEKTTPYFYRFKK